MHIREVHPKIESVSISLSPEAPEAFEPLMIYISDLIVSNKKCTFQQEIDRSQRLPWDRQSAKAKKSASHRNLLWTNPKKCSEARKCKLQQIWPHGSWWFECAESHGSNEFQVLQCKRKSFSKSTDSTPKINQIFQIFQFLLSCFANEPQRI